MTGFSGMKWRNVSDLDHSETVDSVPSSKLRSRRTIYSRASEEQLIDFEEVYVKISPGGRLKW